MLKEILDTAYLHFNRAKPNYIDMKNFKIDLSVFDDFEKIKTIDAFIFRFIKLQDFMGDKLFKELLKAVGEYKDNMALIDVLDKLEKLEIIKESDRWLDYRNIRNKLTHEYPNNEDSIIEGINISIFYFEEIEEILENIKKYIVTKKLIKETNV
jgi:hypothetical protein